MELLADAYFEWDYIARPPVFGRPRPFTALNSLDAENVHLELIEFRYN
jgi:hypothetical protein